MIIAHAYEESIGKLFLNYHRQFNSTSKLRLFKGLGAYFTQKVHRPTQRNKVPCRESLVAKATMKYADCHKTHHFFQWSSNNELKSTW
jgi:hypothetical protein